MSQMFPSIDTQQGTHTTRPRPGGGTHPRTSGPRPGGGVVSGTPAARTGALVLLVLTAGAYLPSPLYPSFQLQLGAGDLVMTLLFAVFALVSAPALLIFGPAADALGARPVLRLSLVAAGIGTLCFALAPSVEWLLAGRVAQGIALGAATGAASKLAGSASLGRSRRPGRPGRPGRRGGGISLGTAAFLSGTALGPVLSGLVYGAAPMPLAAPFVLHLLALILAWQQVSCLPQPVRTELHRWRPTSPRVPAGLRRTFTASALSGFVAWMTAGLYLSVIPTVLSRNTETTVAVTGLTLGCVLVCSLAAQPVVPYLGYHRAQLVGLAALVASLLVLAVYVRESTALTLASALVAGFGHGLTYGAASAAVESATPSQQRSSVTAALYMAFYLGSGVPAIAVGLITLTQSFTVATTWVTLGAAVVAPLAAVAVVSEHHHRRRAQPGRQPGHLQPIRIRWASSPHSVAGAHARTDTAALQDHPTGNS